MIDSILINIYSYLLKKMNKKIKTRSSAAKRYQKTKTGKILHKKAFHGHILEKKSQKRKISLKKKGSISVGDKHAILLMLPNY